jgi:hypothetical protein
LISIRSLEVLCLQPNFCIVSLHLLAAKLHNTAPIPIKDRHLLEAGKILSHPKTEELPHAY